MSVRKKTKKLIPLQIDRKRWGQGNLLLNGKMCCLGFACKKLGVSKQQLEGCGMPSDLLGLDFKASRIAQLLTKKKADGPDDLQTASRAAAINDDPSMTLPEKEEKLKPILAKLGFKVKFIDRIK